MADYRVLAGKKVVTVKFPENKPLFGYKDELQIRLGLNVPIEEGSPTEMVFDWSLDLDHERVNAGLNEFVAKHPGVFVYPGYLADSKVAKKRGD